MVEGSFSISKVVPLIVVVWVLSLVTTLAAMYVVLNFTQVGVGDLSITADKIVDGAINTTKLAEGAVTTEILSDDAVTGSKLAANAIPFMSANGSVQLTKTTETYENVTDLSLTMNVERKCTLLIMFSVQCAISDLDTNVLWRVYVNSDRIGNLWLQPPGNSPKWSSVSYTFCQPNVSPGEYTVYVQWYVSGATAWVADRNLYVIALPTG
ncbi:MAG: hypothetical protein JSV85_00635 [Candidatus Bathyarchaeota archaeon]|nr:MAG: hypothetical protein JSV85_00635 [Candidatus Bathyarchaeota archaeon]